jgi:LysR family transcriptional activator of nhaA
MLNFRHLYYFWIVVNEGGFARAADRLDMAVQTISAQVRELERAVGRQLLKPAGRGVTMTEAGERAYERAEQIFQLGAALLDDMRDAGGERAARLSIGLSDGISKLAAHAVLAPVLAIPSLRLTCHEGEQKELLSELALHRLDLVLACRPAPHQSDLRLVSERLVSSPINWYGPASLVRKAGRLPFPRCLSELPILLPTAHGALRARLDRWFELHGIMPKIAGEFEDSALMAVFAARGLGAFPLAELGAGDLSMLRGLHCLGRAEGVIDEIHAIRSRRGQHHSLAERVITAARSFPRSEP